jgi:hypothetical protein
VCASRQAVGVTLGDTGKDPGEVVEHALTTIIVTIDDDPFDGNSLAFIKK